MVVVVVVVVLLSASLDASARRLRISRLGAEQFQRRGPMTGRWQDVEARPLGTRPVLWTLCNCDYSRLQGMNTYAKCPTVNQSQRGRTDGRRG